ncbi:septation ring formation regulator EzrA [Macrococcus hajekii]|uniref:Septation ring formation regulator EzrA n=1 Tax=Macrococcus hajekii TaxID=198482 RepID=A0A4R6BM18_9STAP|nr:septation ring formation regulator EzrA [Macrococcus hajekii]TDM02687.1 septation ring formation regulator EzrA [Macrococcus hajekii]GGB03057.1 septation ring formation regulator EzrA [Macrococcus hajekii]
MIIYLIVLIIVLILIAVGVMFYLRNQKRTAVEKIEQRKEEIKALPFQDELVKVKNLQLKGEAKAKFEDWKYTWQKLLKEDIEASEIHINEADEALDRFKFRESSERIEESHSVLDSVESKYHQLAGQIDDYVNRAKQDRIKYEECRTIYREAKRDVLANRHQYGEAARPLEENIEHFLPALQEYEQFTGEGNYESAHYKINEVHDQMTRLKSDMDEIPLLIRDVQKELPGQFQEIRYGCRDLKVEGYNLDHVKVDSNLQTLKGKLNLVEPLIARLQLDSAEEIIAEITDTLDEMLELVEIEVLAKNNVEKSKELITDELFYAKDMNYTLRTEIEYVKENYYINEEDIQKVRQYDNEIQSLISVYDEILNEMAKSAVRYSEVEDNLTYIKDHVGVINNNQEKIQHHLTSLRDYEREAQSSTLKIQSRKEEIFRKLMASNLSSIPERFIIMKNEIDIETREAHALFNKRPMYVEHVRDKVRKVMAMMNTFEQEVLTMLDDAELAEALIQYGNRYRKDYPDLNKELNEAERLFSNNRYKRAVEIAEAAIERVSPGAASQIEKRMNQMN